MAKEAPIYYEIKGFIVTHIVDKSGNSIAYIIFTNPMQENPLRMSFVMYEQSQKQHCVWLGYWGQKRHRTKLERAEEQRKTESEREKEREKTYRDIAFYSCDYNWWNPIVWQ